MRVVAYERCSTNEQAKSGLGLEAQAATIAKEVAYRDWTLVATYTDAGASGKSLQGREQLALAIAAVEAGEADALVVAKLDRLSRSVRDFANLVCRAQENGWNLVVLDPHLDLSDPYGAFTAQILCSVAELEREMISARTKSALAAARERGTRLGRPCSIDPDVQWRIVERRTHGATYTTIADELNADCVPTAHGAGRWHPTTVRRLWLSAAR